MNGRREFRPLQAEEIARAFKKERVEYLFIGKSGAILLGYPGMTQDVDVFPARSVKNSKRLLAALGKIGFEIGADLERDILSGKDFVQIKSGPFDLDLIFAPDGIESFAQAKDRAVMEGIFPVANLRDIIASKRASGRQKDKIELPLLESFRIEYEKRNAPTLQSAREKLARKPQK
ncbi:MAG TPA: hypothetical protein VGR14_01720 [Verrucomicrobiae bacterium]|jgi:hypothetical protein|nr:hypothetical protein [Verrucomicrobiae bacterium]